MASLLIELMVVVAIVGVLSAVGLPELTESTRQSQRSDCCLHSY